MAPPFRALQLLHHLRGKVRLQLPETRGFCQSSFSLQRRPDIGRKVNLSFWSRMEEDEAEAEVHPLFRKRKVPNWLKLGLAAVVIGGIYETAKILQWKGQLERLIHNTLMLENGLKNEMHSNVCIDHCNSALIKVDLEYKQMEVYFLLRKLEICAEVYKIENDRHRYYLFVLLKVKSKYEEALNLEVKLLRTIQNLRSEVDKHIDEDETTVRNVFKKWTPVIKELRRQRSILSDHLVEELKHHSGAKIHTADDLLRVLRKELCPPARTKKPIVKEKDTCAAKNLE